MEQKKNSKMKTLLGKGAFVVICIVIAVLVLGGALVGTLFLMRGCRSQGPVVATATPTPAPTPVPGHEIYARKLNEAPPLDQLELSEGQREEYAVDLALPENWLDMTKDGSEGFTILRSVVLGCSYLKQDGTYYRLGEGEDGKGLVDYIVTDFDWDGEPDLLYTYHSGANEENYSSVGWFDLVTHENKMSDFLQQDAYWALIEEDGRYILCTADRSVDPDTLSFGLTVTGRIGEVTEIMGRILLILDAPPSPEPTPE
jgi:hypothetical protein